MKKIILLSIIFSLSQINAQVFKLASGSSTTFMKKEGASGWIDLTNSMAMNHDMTIRFTLTGKNSGAIPSSDLSNLSSTTDTITFGPNATTRRFSFKTVIDNTTEGNDTFIFKLTQAVTMGSIGTPDSVIFIVTDSVATTPVSPSYPYYTISKVRGNNSGNIPDSNNVKCTLRGVLYGENTATTSNGNRFSLCDGTGCIGINSTTKLYSTTFKEGDSVEISGKIGNFSGLAQIDFNLASDSIRFISTKTINSAKIVTTLDESTESALVKLEKLQYVSGTWNDTSDFTIVMKNSAGTEYSIRILNKTNRFGSTNMLVAGKVYNITGLGGQYAFSPTFTGGYQLAPRRKADIVESVSGAISSTINSIYNFKAFPNPINEGILNVEFKSFYKENILINLVDMSGKSVYMNSIKPVLGLNKITIENLSNISKGLYFLQLRNSKTSIDKKIIIE